MSAIRGRRSTKNSRGCTHYKPAIVLRDGETEIRLYDKAKEEAVLHLQIPQWMAQDAWEESDESGATVSAELTVDDARDLRQLLDRFLSRWSEGDVVQLRGVATDT